MDCFNRRSEVTASIQGLLKIPQPWHGVVNHPGAVQGATELSEGGASLGVRISRRATQRKSLQVAIESARAVDHDRLIPLVTLV